MKCKWLVAAKSEIRLIFKNVEDADRKSPVWFPVCVRIENKSWKW